MFLDNLQEQAAKYENDPLSTPYGVHVTGTEDQADSPLWHKVRQFLITASTFLEFIRNTLAVIRKIWGLNQDISSNKYIRWGKENEVNGIKVV